MEQMPALLTTGFAESLLAFVVTVVVFVMGMTLYCLITPHSELKLIRAGNPAASMSFSATALAIAIVLASAVHNTHAPVDILIWGINATLFQLLAYFGTIRLMPELNKAIAEGKVLSALPLAALQLATAILNAALFTG